MIELKKEFDTKKYQMHHVQLYKDEKVVVYRITQPSDNDRMKWNSWYEVFRYTVNKPDKFHDDEWEQYPKSDNYFGEWAWSCSNLDVVKKVLLRRFGMSESDAVQIMVKLGYGNRK